MAEILVYLNLAVLIVLALAVLALVVIAGVVGVAAAISFATRLIALLLSKI